MLRIMSDCLQHIFPHVFSTATGIVFSAYLRDVRLNAAIHLLRATSLTVKEVCYQVGFNRPNYFSDAFKLKYGVSPREYRERYQTEIADISAEPLK